MKNLTQILIELVLLNACQGEDKNVFHMAIKLKK